MSKHIVYYKYEYQINYLYSLNFSINLKKDLLIYYFNVDIVVLDTEII